MNDQKNSKGELTILLTIVSIVFITIGMLVGNKSVKTVKKLSGSAQDNCSYNATAVVVKNTKNGQVVTTNENVITNWGISNNKQSQFNPASRFTSSASYSYSTQNYSFIEYDRFETASVSLIGLNTQKYRIKSVFCDRLSPDDTGCADGVRGSSSGLNKIEGFKVDCGVNIKYGWVVEEIAPQITPSPTIVDDCSFDSVSQIKINGSVAQNIPGFTWISEGDQDITFTQSGTFPPDNPLGTGRLETKWEARPLEAMYRNKHAKTSITIPSGYRVLSTFCQNNSTTVDVCGGVLQLGNQNKTIASIHMLCGGNITYGWNVEPVPTATLTPTIVSSTPTTTPIIKLSITPSPTSIITPTTTTMPTSTITPTKAPEPTCNLTKVQGNGPIRVVIVPQDFLNINRFADYVKNGVSAFYDKTNIDKGKDRSGKLSFYRVSSLSDQGQYADLSRDGETTQAFNDKMRTCNADVGVVIIDHSGGLFGVTAWDRSSIVYTTGTQDQISVTLAHELGHAIGRLEDEYVYTNPDAEIWANCVPSANNCVEWKSKPYSTECIARCASRSHSRSTQNSIMNDPKNGEFNFNDVSLDVWDENFGFFIKEPQQLSLSTNGERSLYHNVHKLDLRNLGDNLSVNSVSVAQTYPDNYKNLPQKENDLLFDVLNDKGDVIYRGATSMHNKLRIESIEGDSLVGQTKTYAKENISLYLPFFSSTRQIRFYDENNSSKLLVNLADYNLPSPVINQDLCGNSVCDLNNGENQNSCSLDCKATVPDTRRNGGRLCKSTDVNADGTANTIDYTIILKRYGRKTNITNIDLNCDGHIDALDISLFLKIFSGK